MGQLQQMLGLLLVFTLYALVRCEKPCPTVYPSYHVKAFNAHRMDNMDSLGNPLYEMEVYEDSVYSDTYQVTIKAYGPAQPMRTFIAVAEEDGKKSCGTGTFLSPHKSEQQGAQECPHVVMNADGRDKERVTFKWLPPKCGCVRIRASVIPVQNEFFLDDADMDTGPLVKRVCIGDLVGDDEYDFKDVDDIVDDMTGDDDDDNMLPPSPPKTKKWHQMWDKFVTYERRIGADELDDDILYFDEDFDDVSDLHDDSDDVYDVHDDYDYVSDLFDDSDDVSDILDDSDDMSDILDDSDDMSDILDDSEDMSDSLDDSDDMSDILDDSDDMSDSLDDSDDMTDSLDDSDDWSDILDDSDDMSDILDDSDDMSDILDDSDDMSDSLDDSDDWSDILDDSDDMSDSPDDSDVSDVRDDSSDESDMLDDSDDAAVPLKWQKKLRKRHAIKGRWNKNKAHKKKFMKHLKKKHFRKGRKFSPALKTRKTNRKIRHQVKLKRAMKRQSRIKQVKQHFKIKAGRKNLRKLTKNIKLRKRRSMKMKKRWSMKLRKREAHQERYIAKICHKARYLPEKPTRKFHRKWQAKSKSEADRNAIWSRRVQAVKMCCKNQSDIEATKLCLQTTKNQKIDTFCLDDSNNNATSLKDMCCKLEGEQKYGCFDKKSVHFWKRQHKQSRKNTKLAKKKKVPTATLR